MIMEEKLNLLIEQQIDVKKSLARLEVSILGDKEAGVVGSASRLKKVEDYIENDKKTKWTFAGVFIAATALFNWLFK